MVERKSSIFFSQCPKVPSNEYTFFIIGQSVYATRKSMNEKHMKEALSHLLPLTGDPPQAFLTGVLGVKPPRGLSRGLGRS